MSRRFFSGLLAVAVAATGCAARAPGPTQPPRVLNRPTLALLPPGERATLSGRVTHVKTGAPQAGLLVVVQCDCLTSPYEMLTDATGLYAARGLPAGKYTVQVLFGQGDVNKRMDVPVGAKFRANFVIDPEGPRRTGCPVPPPWHGWPDRSLLRDRCPRWSPDAPECRRAAHGPVRLTDAQ